MGIRDRLKALVNVNEPRVYSSSPGTNEYQYQNPQQPAQPSYPMGYQQNKFSYQPGLQNNVNNTTYYSDPPGHNRRNHCPAGCRCAYCVNHTNHAGSNTQYQNYQQTPQYGGNPQYRHVEPVKATPRPQRTPMPNVGNPLSSANSNHHVPSQQRANLNNRQPQPALNTRIGSQNYRDPLMHNHRLTHQEGRANYVQGYVSAPTKQAANLQYQSQPANGGHNRDKEDISQRRNSLHRVAGKFRRNSMKSGSLSVENMKVTHTKDIQPSTKERRDPNTPRTPDYIPPKIRLSPIVMFETKPDEGEQTCRHDLPSHPEEVRSPAMIESKAGYNKYDPEEIRKQKWNEDKKLIEQHIAALGKEQENPELCHTNYISPFETRILARSESRHSDSPESELPIKPAQELEVGKTLLQSKPHKKQNKHDDDSESF